MEPGSLCVLVMMALFVVAMVFWVLGSAIAPRPRYMRSPKRSRKASALPVRRRRWEAAAETFGLVYRDNRHDNMLQVDDHLLSGDLHGDTLDVAIRHGEFSAFELELEGMLHWKRPLRCPGLTIVPRRWRLFQGQTIKTGDTRFDQRFWVGADDPQEALRLLTSEVRTALVALYDRAPGLKMDDNQLTWSCSTDHSVAGRWKNRWNTMMRARNGDDLNPLLNALASLSLALNSAGQEVAQMAVGEQEEAWEPEEATVGWR